MAKHFHTDPSHDPSHNAADFMKDPTKSSKPGRAHTRSRTAQRPQPQQMKAAQGAQQMRPLRRRSNTDPYDVDNKASKTKGQKLTDMLSRILLVVGIVLLLIAGGLTIFNQWQYHHQDEINQKLSSFAQVDTSGTKAPEVDWASLKAVNNEAVAWIYIPHTVINFPVYKAADNEKYLHTSAEGEQSLGGQIFMDYENKGNGLQDSQTIIYGHHLRNGAMFKPVVDMTNQEMFDGISTVWYSTENGNYELEPLMVYETLDTDDSVRTFNFSSDNELHKYLTKKLEKAVSKRADAADVIARTRHVLALCTCNYNNGDDGRTILLCVPKTEF